MGYKKAEAIAINALVSTAINPADATTYYFGVRQDMSTVESAFVIYIPYSGMITYCNVMGYATTAGTAEPWVMNLRYGGADYPIATVAASANRRDWINQNMSLPVTAGSTISFKTTTPNWVTDPLALKIMAYFILRY